MKKRMALFLWGIAMLTAFCLNLFGLMHLIPMLITMPLLFLTIFGFISTWNSRNQFRGFYQKRMWH
ncbi:hypothetical protein [Saccharococcus caldoxylosilyticus]|uniref:Uncharacterized protein n=2 Tax=Saccharococcus caldoxylosilyticus TaxID=81408 RepID=A0A023DJB7_9BACL|nr:hypothetical protein [Parageobacillus caldoxylosilyticus]OQP02982.1 hypothetical protein BSK33_09380 [Geobacillus sp. 44B]KYD10524.1 hypothetical protein B4119_0864 [Parageobacillus caldoxylosilyticus]MBB3854160.1 hypothetical protein [Parageobacillus caldoxylosilyticus]QNU38082.1 hypothetical protein IC801_01640 [Geobacillus sp. 44B]QXJ37714.1 hypothetical protein BV455_00977 [Parageobacillus caldoxylosilyticus]